MKTVCIAPILLLAGCLDAAETSDAPELAESASELNLLGNTRLTFYQHADQTGTTFSVELPAIDEYERIRLIPKPEIESAGLLSRISAVRLRCGNRDARVVLMTNYNQSSTDFSTWNHYGGVGRTINCRVGQTVVVNLHEGIPNLGDRVGSAFLVTHAENVDQFAFSDQLQQVWQTAIAGFPSGASHNSTEYWLTSTRRFHIREYLTIDHWACTSRGAVFEYAVQLNYDATFRVTVTDSYVDYGFGDSWGCRDKMKAKLDASIAASRDELAEGLHGVVQFFTAGIPHDRYYLVPDVSLRNFDMYYGADAPVNAPL